jgi:ATP-binding cassette subfamily B (MDR/TAP) protein 1
VYFARFFEDVGSTVTDPSASFGLAKIIDMAVAMCVIGGVMWAGTFVYWSSAEIVAARNVSAMKKAYVSAIVRQDVGWFDTSKPQELATRIGESITLIHKGTRGTALLIFEGVGNAARVELAIS